MHAFPHRGCIRKDSADDTLEHNRVPIATQGEHDGRNQVPCPLHIDEIHRRTTMQEELFVSLLELKKGTIAVIHRLNGGKGISARMSGLGLYEGKRIRVISTAPFSGPLMVEDLSSGARIMIGRGIASRVEVTVEAESK